MRFLFMRTPQYARSNASLAGKAASVRFSPSRHATSTTAGPAFHGGFYNHSVSNLSEMIRAERNGTRPALGRRIKKLLPFQNRFNSRNPDYPNQPVRNNFQYYKSIHRSHGLTREKNVEIPSL
jgi:hypothetical protein